MAMTTSSSSSAPPQPQPQPQHIVVIGGGIQGTSVAYSLAQRLRASSSSSTTITLLECAPTQGKREGLSDPPSHAASSKGGGFMARSWGGSGEGSATQTLHELGFDLYATLAAELKCTSYRKLPVLSVAPAAVTTTTTKHHSGSAASGGGGESGSGGVAVALQNRHVKPLMPAWLDGTTGSISALGQGDDTAQITPAEFVKHMRETFTTTTHDDHDHHQQGDRVHVVHGMCTGIQATRTTSPSSSNNHDYNHNDNAAMLTAITYTDLETGQAQQTLPCDIAVISNGPWACQAEDWLAPYTNLQLPMEGIKSTSMVWEQRKRQGSSEASSSSSSSSSSDNGGGDPEEVKNPNVVVDATALFCGEDRSFGTHLEVYPRPDNSVYICGMGGSDYISKDALKRGAFLLDDDPCDANPERVQAAVAAFTRMSTTYAQHGVVTVEQACMRPCPPDALPYMGRIPGVHGVYINAGHNCWGIAWAPACGQVMAELILDGHVSCMNIAPFDPTRFSPKQQQQSSSSQRGGRGRKQREMNVGEQW